LVHRQMACMFDIPYVGKNSLKAAISAPADLKKFYASNEGAIKETQHSDGDEELEIIVTYDYLEGTHVNPETGSDDYLYNSLIVLRERGK